MAPKKKSTKVQLSDDDKFMKLMEELYGLASKDRLNGDQVPIMIKKYYIDKGKEVSSLKDIVKTKMMNIDPSLLKRAFYYINNVYPKLWPNLNTLDNYFTNDVRVLISKRFGKESEEYKMAKKDVAIPYDVKGQMIKESKQKVEEKNQKPITTTSRTIIDLIKDNIISEEPFRKAVALLIACGSRPVEMILRSTYTEYNNDHKDSGIEPTNGEWVRQTNVAKKRGKDESLLKPIIYLKAEQFISELKYVREKLKGIYGSLSENKDPEKIRSSIRDNMNIVAKNIFGSSFKDQKHEDNKENTLYLARKLYANLSYKLYSERNTIHGETIAHPNWLKKVLGHDGAGSVENYSHVKIINEDESREDLTARQNLLEQKVEQLEERLEEKQVPQAEAEPVPVVSVREEAINKLKPLFNDYVKKNAHRPSQSLFEKLAKGVLPRATIRNVYKELYREAA